MDFIEKYRTRKDEIENDYINACLFIRTYADASNMNIAEVAKAMKFINLHNTLSTYNFNEQLDYEINKNSVLEELLDDVISYGHLYKGSIKEHTYNKFSQTKINIIELNSIDGINYPPVPKNHKDKSSEQDTPLNKALDAVLEFKASFLTGELAKKVLHRQNYYSPFEASCLIAGKMPDDLREKYGAYEICKEWDYLSARAYVKKAFDDGRLYLTEECLGIPAIRLKIVLFEDKKIIEGFNDDILLEIYREYISPVIHIESHDGLFSNGKEKITLRVPSEFEEDLFNSYPMLLERKLKELEEKTDQDDKTTTMDKAYSLIAVLKNLLSDPAITESYFTNSDNDNARKAPIQGELSRHIKEMKIAGLSKRNVDDLFSIANDVLDEVIKRNEA